MNSKFKTLLDARVQDPFFRQISRTQLHVMSASKDLSESLHFSNADVFLEMAEDSLNQALTEIKIARDMAT